MQKRLADFVTGFGIDPEGSTVWGKPVGITSDPAGNLYISSDQVTNAVFRIEPGPLVGAFEHNLPNTVANGSDLPFRAACHAESLFIVRPSHSGPEFFGRFCERAFRGSRWRRLST